MNSLLMVIAAGSVMLLTGCTAGLENARNDADAGKQQLDRNSDARITRAEFDTRLVEVYGAQLKSVGSRGDGSISRKALKAAGKSTRLFGAYDRDNDGAVTEPEFIAYFDARFESSDRNQDGEISMADWGLLDKNNDQRVEFGEYREQVDSFLDEVASDAVPRGYGYSHCSTQYMLCDAGCTRCIALFIPGFSGFSWGGAWTGGTDSCAGVNCGDPWGENYDPLHPCC